MSASVGAARCRAGIRVVADHDGCAGKSRTNATEFTTLTPVPESEMVSGEFEALLATATLPVTLPAAEGLNVAVKVAVCPGLKMSPVETPLALKPAPEIADT